MKEDFSMKRVFLSFSGALATLVFILFLAKTNGSLAKTSGDMPQELMAEGTKAYNNAQKLGKTSSKVGIVVDLRQPSDKKRLWAVNFATGKILLNTYVSHGVGSGGKYATSFSNKVGSHQSSIGAYLVKESYYGHHGQSLRLQGLEPNNNNAYKRAIVMHSANYVEPSYIAANNQAGRSFGCFAVSKEMIGEILKISKEYSNPLLLAYYPDNDWLKNSQYV